ncbi:MAG: hypothetical protein M5U20_09360 [Phycisphaerales bacterium]|nr:hypothetical protein [Phycisphaerales bacterium]
MGGDHAGDGLREFRGEAEEGRGGLADLATRGCGGVRVRAQDDHAECGRVVCHADDRLGERLEGAVARSDGGVVRAGQERERRGRGSRERFGESGFVRFVNSDEPSACDGLRAVDRVVEVRGWHPRRIVRADDLNAHRAGVEAEEGDRFVDLGGAVAGVLQHPRRGKDGQVAEDQGFDVGSGGIAS